MTKFLWAIALLAGFGFGVALGYYLRKLWAIRRRDTIEARIEGLINEAKARQKEILLEANDKALKVLEEVKVEERKRQAEFTREKQRLEKRETLFDQKILEIESKKQEIVEKVAKIEQVKAEIAKLKDEQLARLEQIAALSQADAKRLLFEQVERRTRDDLMARIRKLNEQSSQEVERQAKKLLSLAIQRCASSHAAEVTTATLDLPSDEMKGRIIGREGRNIKAIEQLTGVEIIVDDTPQAITVSGFSPIRRQVAKLALTKLIADGRIHPGRIEEAVEQAKKELAADIKKAGEDALYEVGITGIHPKLVSVLGRLKYRTSYGQNILHHSVEVAYLAGLIAEELGADVALAKKGGLFHDIGKAVDHEVQGGHPEIGYNILKKFTVGEEVAQIAKTHHDDTPELLEALIVKVADAISGARPGARKDTYEKYIQRLEELEQLASSFAGVEKSYAIQAGREVRVFVVPQEVDDLQAYQLAQELARRIEQELKYPGEIRVCVIRETRVIEYAR